ncbi:hypothetical protein [Vibrio sp. WXL103]|uniref:hypothetical protein n=1 Tax=unclassified Vibrio TaxID=2614977 RepID=UPI003EC8D72D
MKQVGLITLHGMGKIKPNYYATLEKKLKNELGDDWHKVSFHNVQYAPYLQEPQDKLWREMTTETDNDLDNTKLRKFLLYGFGDAGSLEYSGGHSGVKYLEVQREILKQLEHVYLDLEQNETKPLIIIAQSLGGQVISNFIWDALHNKQIFETQYTEDNEKAQFMKLGTLQKLVTTGCNIPLFICGLEHRQCFDKPNDQFTWDNYYDPDDVLGWPLAQLGPNFEIVNDRAINSGGLLSSWNPLSHGEYWSDNDVVDPLVRALRAAME